MIEKLDRLKSTRIFRNFSDEELHNISRKSMEKIYPADAVIIQEGSDSEGLFVIESGKVKIVKGLNGASDDNAIVIAELKEGDHFGEMSLIDRAPASAGVIALIPTICHVLKHDDYIDLLNENPGIALKLYRFYCLSLVQRLRRTDEYLFREMVKGKRHDLDTKLFSQSD